MPTIETTVNPLVNPNPSGQFAIAPTIEGVAMPIAGSGRETHLVTFDPDEADRVGLEFIRAAAVVRAVRAQQRIATQPQIPGIVKP